MFKFQTKELFGCPPTPRPPLLGSILISPPSIPELELRMNELLVSLMFFFFYLLGFKFVQLANHNKK